MTTHRLLSRAVAAALNRREFLAAAAAATAAASLPVPALAAAPIDRPQPLEDWTIDDMWGVYPRYAEPIGYGSPVDAPLVAAANSVDAAFAV